MADTLILPHSVSAVTVYAIIRDADGAVWNGAAFESYVTANLGNYDIPMTEQGTASRVYAVAFPALSAGLYRVAAYQQAGGAPAETDSLIGASYGEWDGSRFVRLGDPAGVSIAADIIALKAVADAVKAKTDNLPSDPADASDIAAAIAALNDLSAAEVNAEVVDALATDTYAEPTGVPGATLALSAKISWVYMALRNGLTVTSSKKTFLDDGGAGEWSKALSDDGVTYSEGEAAVP